MKRIVFLLIGFAFSYTVYAQNNIDWEADLDYLSKELPEKHCYFFMVKSMEDFISGINAIKSESRDSDDFHVVLKTQQLIAGFGDSHTSLDISGLADKEKMLPMRLLWTSDGLHIIQTTYENREILGCRLTEVNKTPVSVVIDSLSTLFTIDNRSVVKSVVPQFIFFLEILEHFGFSDGTQVEIGLKTGSGDDITYVLKPAQITRDNRAYYEPDSLSFCMRYRGELFTDFYNPGDKIYYMLYNRCSGREVELMYGNEEKAKTLPSFKEFEERAFGVLEERPVEKIVFDLRFNGGGSSEQGSKFIKRLAGFLDANPDVRTYVVLGRDTFSSAVLNAMDFKRLTNAVFVGEETAGKPNHFGEVRSFRLPHSKVQVRYSTKYFKRADEDVNTIRPDVEIGMSFSDFTKGVDPVYEWIKEQ